MNNYPNSNIPINNIYFLSIESFNWLCSLLKEGSHNIAGILDCAIKNDASSKTSAIIFYDHIQHIDNNLKNPAYCSEAINELTDYITKNTKEKLDKKIEEEMAEECN